VSELSDPEILRAILQSLPTGLYVVNREQKILFWSDGAERITGYLRQDVLGRSWHENLAPPENSRNPAPAHPSAVIDSALRDGRSGVAEVSAKHKDGHRIPLRIHTVPVRDSRSVVIAAAQSFNEPAAVSAWDQRQNKLAAVGCLDTITGALNRNFILFHLRESLATFAEHHVPFSIVCIQVDRLDHFRHQYGPGAVSAILRAVAQTLEASLRPTDFLGRLDDHQFLAILTECTEAEIEKVTERLAKMVTYAEIRWWGDEISVTASFAGASVAPKETAESILDRAQESLRRALASAGNHVTLMA
jgi:diguanylate cyclase (GGDEF)-like protein/PAS domain S-box-containing protein